MTARRVGLSDSPLARPDAPIHKLAVAVQRHLYLPSPDQLYTVLGAVAGNMLRGSPIWLVIVGPPSGGKTILLDPLYYTTDYKLDRVAVTDLIKNPSALLSGTPAKERGKGATGGLLKEIGKYGILILKDFTTMMSVSHDNLMEVMGALRRVYDGAWDRSIGSEGGKRLSWDGKIGFLSACTNAIDTHHVTLGELGERWIYFRLLESDGYGETMSALDNRDPESAIIEIHLAFKEFFDEMGLSWVPGLLERRELEDREKTLFYFIGRFISVARTPIKRDWKTKEVAFTMSKEAPTRLAKTLAQLYLGLEVIGLAAEERWPLVRRVAMDSMPEMRKTVVELLQRQGSARLKEIRLELKVGSAATRYVTEDLETLGVVERVGARNRMVEDGTGNWRLTQWSRKHLKMGWGA